MTSTIRFIDANIFILNVNNHTFLDSLNPSEYATSILVLSETFHKLTKRYKEQGEIFNYIRSIMGCVHVYDVTQNDFFLAMTSSLQININDKIHIATMKRNNITVILSYDTDFDKDKTIQGEEI